MKTTEFAFFGTADGIYGIAWTERGIVCVQFPERRQAQTLAKMAERFGALQEGKPTPFVKTAIEKIVAYCQGQTVDFSGLPLDLTGVPPFHARVYAELRKISFGRLVTYRDLAVAAGSAGASRAVGQAMARNPLPLLIPCHRVVASDRRLGGFSAPGGAVAKQALLDREGIDLVAATTSHPDPLFDPATLAAAQKTLKKRDRRLGALMEKVGPCVLERDELVSPFQALCEAIVGQQLNPKAAATILKRVTGLFPGKPFPEPVDVRECSDEQLRGAGLSGAKILAVRDLAEKTLGGLVPPVAQLMTMPDEEIIERLTAIRGIGRWTVEMMLVFRLGRPDILAVDDYGLRRGYAVLMGLAEVPKPRELGKIGEKWQPYRSIASWYLWRANEQGPIRD